MDPNLRNLYTRLINKHFSAVQTDTALEHTDNWKLESKTKQFWKEFKEAEKEFFAWLEKR